MKLAVTYNPKNGEIFQHFGRTETFKVYDLADGKIQKAEVCSTQGQGHGALVGVLQQLGAEAVICGGIGGGAQEGLKKAGIAFLWRLQRPGRPGGGRFPGRQAPVSGRHPVRSPR